jgi:UDPglucose 6-dehydrogenase
MKNIETIFDDKIVYATDQYKALEGADFLVIATEWNTFRSPDFNKIKSLLKSTLIFDGRNLYDLDEMKENGFQYFSIGRKEVNLQ